MEASDNSYDARAFSGSVRMAESDSLQAWFRLRAVQGIGDATYHRLIQALGSPEAVLRASRAQLMTVEGVSDALAHAIRRGPDDTARQAIDADLAVLARLGLSCLTLNDSRYPVRLKTIHDPPPILYVSGNVSRFDQPAVAIVGSRKATTAGRAFTEQLSAELASVGFTVVSGLARGIDAAAHRGALHAKGCTIAVLGCGLDKTYPPEHQALRKQIEIDGAVLSELPFGSYPHGYHFPRRNRIISGMCLGVVVTEAAMESGSLITARLAAEQGREVFAVPGFVKAETSRGSNGLIKQGATLVESIDDIISELKAQLDRAFRSRLAASCAEPPADRIELTENERRLYQLLTWEGVHIDDLIEQSGSPAADVSATLLALELKRFLRQLPGHFYVRL